MLSDRWSVLLVLLGCYFNTLIQINKICQMQISDNHSPESCLLAFLFYH